LGLNCDLFSQFLGALLIVPFESNDLRRRNSRDRFKLASCRSTEGRDVGRSLGRGGRRCTLGLRSASLTALDQGRLVATCPACRQEVCLAFLDALSERRIGKVRRIDMRKIMATEIRNGEFSEHVVRD